MAANAVTKFIAALQSLVRQGLSKQAAEQFAKNEFGEISKFLQKRIDDVYKNPKGEGIESIKIKDEVFDDTVIKLPIDDTGVPFNPNNPLKQYGKPKKSIKERMDTINETSKKLDDILKEREKMFKPKKITDVEEAIDNASPGFAGDRKYDAQLVADDLAEKRFGKEFYDLDEIDQMELYDEAYQGLTKQKFDPPEDMATGGRAGYGIGSLVQRKANSNQNQNMPAVDARMNLDYNTLINQNEAQRNLQAQNRNPGIMRPTMADVAGAAKTDPRFGIKEAFLNERLTTGPSQGQLFTGVVPDYDRYGTYTGSDQLIKDYAAAGLGTPTANFVKLPEGNPYAVSGPGYYSYDGTNFSKQADLNMTPEYEKFIRSNYNLNQINQNTVPRKITQDDIDTANFFGPMYTGFDYSKENNWSPGQPAPDGYRVVDMMGDQFLERMYPSKEEIARLPGIVGPMGLMRPEDFDNYANNFQQNPDAGLSGQEYAEKYNIPYASGGRAGYYTGGMVDVEPSLSDIGHGSDALMARTRLVSPGSQSTTSTGLNYLLAEDNDNIRVPFSKGKGVDLLRRGFLKTMGAAGAGIAALKTGLLGLGGKQATKEVVKEIITTPAAAGKPAWFDTLVTRVINEGEDVTKKFATKDREIVHATKIDDDAMVTVYRDLDDGTVRVDIDDATTNVMGEQGDSVVSLQVKGGQLEEGVKGKTPVEFEAVENDYRNYTTSPDGDYDTEVVENVVNNTKDLTADLTKVKMYAKGQKKPTIKEMMIQRDRAKRLDQAAKDPADYASDRGPDIDTKDYDYASGGIARMIGE